MNNFVLTGNGFNDQNNYYAANYQVSVLKSSVIVRMTILC